MPHAACTWDSMPCPGPSVIPCRSFHNRCRVPEECPQEVADLIAACMASAPEQRPTAEGIIAALTPLLVASPASATLRDAGPTGQTPRAGAPPRQPSDEQASPLGAHAGGTGAGADQLPTGPSERLSTPGTADAPAQQQQPILASPMEAAGTAQQPWQQQQGGAGKQAPGEGRDA